MLPIYCILPYLAFAFFFSKICSCTWSLIWHFIALTPPLSEGGLVILGLKSKGRVFKIQWGEAFVLRRVWILIKEIKKIYLNNSLSLFLFFSFKAVIRFVEFYFMGGILQRVPRWTWSENWILKSYFVLRLSLPTTWWCISIAVFGVRFFIHGSDPHQGAHIFKFRPKFCKFIHKFCKYIYNSNNPRKIAGKSIPSRNNTYCKLSARARGQIGYYGKLVTMAI